MNHRATISLLVAVIVAICVISAITGSVNNSNDTPKESHDQYELEFYYDLIQESDTDIATCWNGRWAITFNNGYQTYYEYRIIINNLGERAYTFQREDFGMIDNSRPETDNLVLFTSYKPTTIEPGEIGEVWGLAGGQDCGGIALNPDKTDEIHASFNINLKLEPSKDEIRTNLEIGDYYTISLNGIDGRVGNTEPSIYVYSYEISSINTDGTYDTNGSIDRINQTFDDIVSQYGIALPESVVTQYLEPNAQSFIYESYLGPKQCFSITIEQYESGYESSRTYYIGTEATNGYYPVYWKHTVEGWFYADKLDSEMMVLYCTFFETAEE